LALAHGLTASSQQPTADQLFHFAEQPGPHAVGLKVVNQYDYSRTFLSVTNDLGKPTTSERARPIQTLIWYPASVSSGTRLTVGDYTQLLSTETNFDKPQISSDWQGWIKGMAPTLKDGMRAMLGVAPAAGRFPVVIYAPSFGAMSWENADLCEYLASHGYVVLLPNPRGSDGQGTDFARAVGNDWGGMDYQDILDGVDSLVARKIADPARLGIGGWSYGGFMAAWAVTHGDRFKAAIVGAGPTDMVPFARITDTPDFPLGYYGDVPGHLADYDRSSSARILDKVTTPVLVLHGEQDTRVPITLGLEFYRGLKMLGKPAEMIRYPREPHWFHEPAHQEDIQRRVLAWFDSHL